MLDAATDLAARGRYGDAVELLRESLAALDAGGAAAGHPFRGGVDPASRGERAELLTQLGAYEWQLARFPAAEAALGRALALLEDGAPEAPARLGALERLGAVYHYTGRHHQAVQAFAEVVRARRRAGDDVGVALARRGLGTVLRDEGDHGRARFHLEEAAETLERRLGTWHAEVAAALKALAYLDLCEGLPWQAEDRAERALTACHRAHGDQHPLVAGALLTRGAARGQLGRRRAAAEDLAEAERLVVAGFGPTHPLAALALAGQARLAESEARFVDAEALHRRAVDVYAHTYGASVFLVGMLLEHSRALTRLRRLREARAPLERALPLCAGEAERATREHVVASLRNLCVAIGDDAGIARWDAELPEGSEATGDPIPEGPEPEA
jgi:tetratricopeptide (TPR) repeat protein